MFMLKIVIIDIMHKAGCRLWSKLTNSQIETNLENKSGPDPEKTGPSFLKSQIQILPKYPDPQLWFHNPIAAV